LTFTQRPQGRQSVGEGDERTASAIPTMKCAVDEEVHRDGKAISGRKDDE
jgi:hypothetical protein